MRRRLLLLPVLLAAGLAGPPAHAASSRPDVRAFARASLAFDLTRGKAIGRAERRGDARRTAALACLDAVRGAPTRYQDELSLLYTAYVGAGYFEEDEPAFVRWVRALQAVRTTDPVLRRARTTLAAELGLARSTYRPADDFCGPATSWAAARWKASGTPAAVIRVKALAARAAAGGPDRISAAARLVELRGGAGRQLAASVLREGIDEGEEVVVRGDDPIVRALG